MLQGISCASSGRVAPLELPSSEVSKIANKTKGSPRQLKGLWVNGKAMCSLHGESSPVATLVKSQEKVKKNYKINRKSQKQQQHRNMKARAGTL